MSLQDSSQPCDCRENLSRARKESESVLDERLGFLSTVSHEIRTPLNAIIGISDLLQQTKTREEQEEYLQILKQTSDSLLELVNNVLDFSKINSGILKLSNKPFNLRNTINRSLYGERLKANTKGLLLEVEVDSLLPELLVGDSVKIGQVVMNLVSNAIKFTEEGKVSVSVYIEEFTPEEVLILCAVSDTGIGIPQEQLENIFEAFNQGSEDINIRYAGTGLGLSISRSVLEMLGSELKVESTEGEGSEFSFRLRLPISSFFEDPELHAQVNSLTVKGTKILLVEDNKINVLVAQKYLTNWGVLSDTAYNGQEALEMIQQEDYDVVLMDLQMPVMDGFEAVRALRELPDEKYRSLPVIALTAASEQLYQEAIKEAGFNDFVNKPFHPEDLLKKIVQSKEIQSASC